MASKIDSFVHFPSQLKLDFNHMNSNIRFGNHYEYELTAVCLHGGFSLDSGHYIGKVKF